MKTDAEIKVYDNLQISTGGKLLCKVTAALEEGWLLWFTSVPPEFTQWREDAAK